MNWWAEFPRWLRLYTLVVGLPAIAILAYPIITTNELEPMLDKVAFAMFASVAALQILFVVKAFARGEM